MFAFISNEYRTIVHTADRLELLLSIYSYPKFVKVNSEAEAKDFFRQQDRAFIKRGALHYGGKEKCSYVTVEYFIADSNIYCNIDTSNFGYVRLGKKLKNVSQEATYDLLRVKIKNVVLNDELIAHHCLAIHNILSLFEDYVNVEFIVPDISVFLACTKYGGKDGTINRTKNFIKCRSGEVYFTIK